MDPVGYFTQLNVKYLQVIIDLRRQCGHFFEVEPSDILQKGYQHNPKKNTKKRWKQTTVNNQPTNQPTKTATHYYSYYYYYYYYYYYCYCYCYYYYYYYIVLLFLLTYYEYGELVSAQSVTVTFVSSELLALLVEHDIKVFDAELPSPEHRQQNLRWWEVNILDPPREPPRNMKCSGK